jgi:uncharacterized membrane protein
MMTEIFSQYPLVGILTVATLLGIAAFFVYVIYFLVHGIREDKRSK